MGGDHRIGLPPAQRQQKLAPGAHLDIARRVQLHADRARQIDIEPDQRAVLVVEIEGRVIALGEEAYDDAPRRLARLLARGWDVLSGTLLRDGALGQPDQKRSERNEAHRQAADGRER